MGDGDGAWPFVSLAAHRPSSPEQTLTVPTTTQATNPRRRWLRPTLISLAGLLTLCCLGTVIIGLVAPDKTKSPVAVASSGSAHAADPVGAANPPLPTATVNPTPTTPTVHTSTTKAKPPATKTTTKPAAPNLCGAPSNPYGYTFCGGSRITKPAAAICDYLECIANFWNGNGYVVECKDFTFSKSGGIQGVCSHHSGYLRDLYA